MVSPLRVSPKHWARFARKISSAFDEGELPDGFAAGWSFRRGVDYKYHPISDTSVAQSGLTLDQIETALPEAMGRVRRCSFAYQVLFPGALLFVLDTGEAMVVEMHDLAGDTNSILSEIERVRAAASHSVRNAWSRLSDLAKSTEIEPEQGETITHTILLSVANDSTKEEVAFRCCRAEGLDLQDLRAAQGSEFVTGWSYSVFSSALNQRLWDGVAVVARAQCEWYSVRVARRYCLGTLANSDLKRSVRDLVAREQSIVSYQTTLRLWHHRMGEYRANLKPELTDQAQKIEDMWDVKGALDYVLATLTQARDLIETSYSRRILLQERRQSQMLFFLTVLGVLSVASIAASYWDWLTLARLTDDASVSTQIGQIVVAAGLGALVIAFSCLIALYIRIRRSPD